MVETRESMKRMNLSEEHQNAIRIYNEFKKLREQIGKPVKEYTDREQIIKDLRGEGFATLRKEIDQRKKSKTRHHIA